MMDEFRMPFHNYADDEVIYWPVETDDQAKKIIPQDQACQGIYHCCRMLDYTPIKAAMYVWHCTVRDIVPMPKWLEIPDEDQGE